MRVVVNGVERELSDGVTVAEFLMDCSIDVSRAAVELNLEILSRERYAETALRDGDRLEVLAFVGGG